MNTNTYTCIDKYNFNFSKMAIDTMMKFSTYTKLLTGFLTTYHLYM